MSEIPKANGSEKKSKKEKSSAEKEKVLIKYYIRKIQRNGLSDGELKTLEPFAEGIGKLILLGKEIQEARAKAAEFISMLENETASLHDFYRLEPVSGLTLLAVMTLSDEKTSEKAQKLIAGEKSNQGKLGAAARHKQDYERREDIRSIWARGNYKTRVLCAEEECGGLGMSLDTARKALNLTPDPDPWPAKQKTKSKKK